MKKYTYFLMFFIQTIFSSIQGYQIDTNVTIGAGYRYDDLQWSVSCLPFADVLTEEKWKSLQIAQISGKIETYICKSLYIRGEGDYGWICHGKKTFDEFDLSGFVSDTKEGWLQARTRGHVYDFSGALGYSFQLFCSRIQCMPLAGYSSNNQKFKDNHYHDKLSLLNFFEDVSSSYTYHWNGPWAGLQLTGYLNNDFKTTLEYQYHWSRYRAKIQDNLISDDEHEKQKSHHVHGHDFTLGFYYTRWNCWQLGLVGNYKYWFGKKGKSIIEDQKLAIKNLNWRSISVQFDVSYQF